MNNLEYVLFIMMAVAVLWISLGVPAKMDLLEKRIARLERENNNGK